MATPPWQPHPIILANGPGERSPDALRQTLRQFQLETDERYKPGSFKCDGTRCNIFLWDGTAALECMIPHQVDNNGQSVLWGTKDSHELSALGMIDWLRVFGPEKGWQPVSMPEAIGLANQGRPVLAAWVNPNHYDNGKPKPSHVAILLPTPAGEKEPRIAQAGTCNFFDRPLTRGFGHFQPILFWAHD